MSAVDTESLELTDFLPSGKPGLSEAGTLRIGYEIFEKNGIVSFKVTHGNKLKFEKGEKGFTWQDDSEGAATVKCLDYLEFPIDINQAGEYQLWFRAYFPFNGTWLHFESMDDGEKIRNIDNPRNKDLVGKWVWVKGPRYKLDKGRHVWKLDGWRGGTSLDRVVFALDPRFSPKDPGPEATCKLAAKKVFFISGEIAPGIKRWGEISWKTNGQGEARCFVFAGGAKSWPEVKNGTDLRKIIKTKSTRVRFALMASRSGASPILQSIKLYYEPDTSLFKTLENNEMKLVFSPAGIREIIDKKTGVSFRSPTMTTEFFRLKVKKPGYNPQEELTPSKDAKCVNLTAANNVLTGEYHFLKGKLIVKPIVKLEKGSISRWEMVIENNSNKDVTEIQYPFLRSLRAGDSDEDDILIINSVWGQMIRQPARWKQKYTTVPSLRFLDLYDGKSGIYIADHNTNFGSFNDLAMYIVPSEDATSIDLNWTKFIRVAPGKKRKVENFVVAFHQGDWHAAADFYRREVVSKLKKPFYPEWVKACDGWSNTNGFWPSYGFNILQRYLDEAKKSGLLFMGGNRLAMSSCAYGYGGFYPYPTPTGGTPAEARQYFDEIREEGGDTNFYIAVNLHSPLQCKDGKRIAGYAPKSWMEPDTKYYDLDFYHKNASRPHEGEINAVKTMKSQYRTCPGARGWRDYLKHWTTKYVRDYHTYIYFDCTSCGIAYGLAGICANLDHGHDDYGVYYSECTKALQETATLARKYDPDYIFSGEGCNDMTGQSGILHMCSGVINRTEIFRYTVPDQICLDGNWNSGTRDKHGGYKKFHHIFLTGCRLDGLPDRAKGNKSGAPSSKDFAQKLLALRRQTKQYLYPARFMDTVDLIIYDNKGGKIQNPLVDKKEVVQIAPVDGIQAKWFLLNKGYNKLALVNCLNDDDKRKNGKIAVKADRIPQVKKAWAFDLDGKFREVKCSDAGGAWSFEMPATTLSTVALIDQAFPRTRIEGNGVSVTAAGETIKPEIHIRNLEAVPGKAVLSWKAPDGCKTEKVSVGTLNPGEEKVVVVPLTIAKKIKNGRYDMSLLVDWRGQQDEIYHRLSVADPVLVRLSEDYQKNLALQLINLSGNTQAVAGTIEAARPLSVSEAAVKVKLKPKEKKTITVNLAGWEKASLPLRAKVDLAAGGNNVKKSLLMYPYVPNGDFESDEAGDLHPDWWTGWTHYGPDEAYRYIHLDPAKKVSGKYSLRLDPHPKKEGHIIAQPMVCRLKANKKYKVSVDIFRTENTGGVHAVIQRVWLGNKNFKSGQWQHFEGTFNYRNPIQFPDRKPGYDWIRWIRLYNKTRSPAWFDNLRIEEVN